MGHSGFSRASYDKALGGVFCGDYKYLILLIPKDREQNQIILGEYELFKELDE